MTKKNWHKNGKKICHYIYQLSKTDMGLGSKKLSKSSSNTVLDVFLGKGKLAVWLDKSDQPLCAFSSCEERQPARQSVMHEEHQMQSAMITGFLGTLMTVSSHNGAEQWGRQRCPPESQQFPQKQKILKRTSAIYVCTLGTGITGSDMSQDCILISIFIFSMCVWMCRTAHTVETGGQLSGVISLLMFCGTQRPSSGWQACAQARVPSKPPC